MNKMVGSMLEDNLEGIRLIVEYLVNGYNGSPAETVGVHFMLNYDQTMVCVLAALALAQTDMPLNSTICLKCDSQFNIKNTIVPLTGVVLHSEIVTKAARYLVVSNDKPTSQTAFYISYEFPLPTVDRDRSPSY